MKAKFSLKTKLTVLIITISVVLIMIAVITSYNVHTRTIDDYYKSLVSQVGRSGAGLLDADLIDDFLDLIKSSEYQQILSAAVQNEDESMIIDYLKEKGMYESFVDINARIDELQKNMEVKYIYLESIQGTYSISLFDPQESVLNFGQKLDIAEEFGNYSTNDPYPATISKTEYGWLCSGYESIINSDGEKIAVIGVDIDMNDIVKQRRALLFRLIASMIIFVAAAIIFSAYFMNKMVVNPLNMLAYTAKKFVRSETYTLDNIADFPIHTGDEIEELYSAFKKMEQDIVKFIGDITRVTAEKERIGAELNVAAQIQADMLPRIFPAFPDRTEFDIYASMNPAKEVGGDFYDYFLTDDDHLVLLMADVSGKGVPAALFMVIAKTLIKNRAQMGGSPAEILYYVNNQLCEGNEAEFFVTVWLAVLEISTGKGIEVNAGHEHPVICRKGGKYELSVYRHSPAVATMEDIRFKEYEFELHPGDCLYVYTDGVPEATNADNELFGTDRMLAALNESSNVSAEEVLETVNSHIGKFVGNAPQFDDITMLCLKYFGKNGGLNEED